jgi:hypothetical protein
MTPYADDVVRYSLSLAARAGGSCYEVSGTVGDTAHGCLVGSCRARKVIVNFMVGGYVADRNSDIIVFGVGH